MTGICVDTSAYSHFHRGESRVIEQIDRARWIGVPSIVVGELHAGFRAGTRFDQNLGDLTEFLRQPVVQVLAVDEEVARIYGEIVSELRAAGRPLPTNDIWIAATAVRFGATVLTFDSHYRAIGRVGSIVLEGA